MKGLKIIKPGFKKVFMQIVIVGGGANGSHFFRNFLQDIATYKSKQFKNWSVDITLVDKDKVEEKNLSNQLFTKEDIGDYKIVSLAERYGDHYNEDVKTVTDYITNLDMLHRLFGPMPVNEEIQVMPILISMVDNVATRKIFDEFFFSDYLPDLIYIDAGVEGVSLDENLSEEEKDETGFYGQICTGFKLDGKVWLEPVMSVYPYMWESDDHLPEQSCGEAIINNPQRCQTNKMAAQLSNGIMNNLMHNQTLYTHHIQFNALFGTSQAFRINKKIIKEYHGEATNSAS